MHPDRTNHRAAGIHYTTIGVLMQMLQRQQCTTPTTLRLYDSMHLNDPDEGNYLPRSISGESQFAWVGARRQLLHQDETSGTVDEIAYMASFIAGDTASDNLVFWRTYGREGKGCSILYSVEARYLQQILYGDGVKETIELLRPILESLAPIVAANGESIHDLLAATVWSSVAKHTVSVQEHSIRVRGRTQICPAQLRSRSSRHLLRVSGHAFWYA